MLAALAFVSLGLPDGLLGVAWPSIRASFGLELDALGALLVAATTGYVASSFSSGHLLGRINLGTVLAVSCGLTATALLGYASASAWLAMLALGALLGLGSGAIDAALNTYVATHHGPRMLNWLHACFGVGAASGPLVMTAVLESGSTWRRGYAIVGLAQLALAGCFVVTFRSWPRSDGAGHGGARAIRNDGVDAPRARRLAWHRRLLRLFRRRGLHRRVDLHAPDRRAEHGAG